MHTVSCLRSPLPPGSRHDHTNTHTSKVVQLIEDQHPRQESLLSHWTFKDIGSSATPTIAPSVNTDHAKRAKLLFAGLE